MVESGASSGEEIHICLRGFAIAAARTLILSLAFGAPSTRAAERLTVAAAANFVFALDDLQAEFEQSEPGMEFSVAIGSSGGLTAQIKNGAPFDVFLSADLDYPRALIAAHVAEADSLRTFAIGRLVLWTTSPAVDLSSITDALNSPAVIRLAIAQIETAPYGRAARETLLHLDLWEALQPKIVLGENVSQAAQYVETGNAQAGFVALSLLESPQLRKRGRWLAVPAAWHAPLEHGVVITTHGADNPVAQRFVSFLDSENGRAVLQRSGYDIP